MIPALIIILYKECTVDNRAKEVISADRPLDKYMNKTTRPCEKILIEKLLTCFQKHQEKRAARDNEQFIKKSSISICEITCG